MNRFCLHGSNLAEFDAARAGQLKGRRWLLGAAVTLAPVLLATAASAAAPRPSFRPPQENNQPMAFTVEGRITDKSAAKLTINSQDNIIFTVRYSEKTTITRSDGSPGNSADLKIGVRVSVQGDLSEQGDVIAKKITLEKEAPPKRKTDPPSSGAEKAGCMTSAPNAPRLISAPIRVA